MDNSLFSVALLALLMGCEVQARLDKSEFTPKLLETMNIMHETCVSQSGVSEDAIAKIMNGEFIDDPKVKLYMKCGCVELSVMDESGKFDLDVIPELVPAKYLSESLKNLNTCVEQTKDVADVNDKVFNIFKCYYNLNPDLFIFF